MAGPIYLRLGEAVFRVDPGDPQGRAEVWKDGGWASTPLPAAELKAHPRTREMGPDELASLNIPTEP